MDHITQQLEHLKRMAALPGWKAHAWHRAQEMAVAHPMYTEVPRLLTEAMRSAPTLPDATDTAMTAQAVPLSTPNASTAAAVQAQPAAFTKSGPSRRQSSRAR